MKRQGFKMPSKEEVAGACGMTVKEFEDADPDDCLKGAMRSFLERMKDEAEPQPLTKVVTQLLTIECLTGLLIERIGLFLSALNMDSNGIRLHKPDDEG